MISFLAVAGVSLLVVSFLLTAHYLIYVNGKLAWYGHPLAVAFDATHPQSMAAWFGSQLWLLCLVSTTLTFQLRRHKLDDYTGEYRLWFWLVVTCVLASIDSTTRVSELLGYALDRWTQVNMGWSGIAVVHSTMAVLVGVLGIRLVSELKAVPLSLICWLGGIVCWAASAALSQDLLRVDISLQMRFWLRAAFWLGGLTLVWIASLAYLRCVYVEAQRRFLLRNKRMMGRKLRASIPQRLRASLTFNPLAILGSRRKGEGQGVQQPSPVASQQRSAPSKPSGSSKSQETQGTATPGASNSDGKPRWFERLWPGNKLLTEDADEYCKVRRTTASAVPEKSHQVGDPTPTAQPALDRQTRLAEQTAAKKAKRADKEAQRESARQARAERRQSGQGWKWSRLIPIAAVISVLRKLKLPSLSGFKLSPPETEPLPTLNSPPAVKSSGSPIQSPKPVSNDRPFPSTVRTHQVEDDDLQDDERQLSRAERKKLRRQGRAA